MTITPERSRAWHEHRGMVLGEDPDDSDLDDYEEADRDRIDDR